MKHPNHRKERQLRIISNGTREDVIYWLAWNDANGCFTDQDCIDEGLPKLNLVTAIETMVDTLTACDPCLDYLTAEYQRLMPNYGCALETLADRENLSRAQIDYLERFTRRWDEAEQAQEDNEA